MVFDFELGFGFFPRFLDRLDEPRLEKPVVSQVVHDHVLGIDMIKTAFSVPADDFSCCHFIQRLFAACFIETGDF